MNEGFNVQTAQSDEWETPPWLFKALDAEFGFTFDAAATEKNALCANYFTGDQDNDLPWHGRVFCNPPYSNIEAFVSRALRHPNLSVLLLPVRTDSDWFHALQRDPRVAIRYFRKRIQFCFDGKPAGSPRFASMIAVIQ